MGSMPSGSLLRIGIDEAGRGSIVGEMFIAAIVISDEDEKTLIELGVKDSKKLSEKQRRDLYHVLKRWPFSVTVVTPREIDTYNVNVLEEVKILSLLENLRARLGDEILQAKIVIDRFGDPSRLLSKLRAKGFKGQILIEEKADDKYVEVAAASIIAKHLRDVRIKVLTDIYGVEGSGYPSDERTLKWLEMVLKRGDRLPILRYSWETLEKLGYKKIKKKSNVYYKSLDEYL
ncbi:MAG: ribonuclease HII [Acidilobaceae archaeon]